MTTVTDLLHHPRYEVIPLSGTEEAVLEHVPTEVTVTITTSPAKGLEPTLSLTERLAEHGYKVVPHLAARHVRDRVHLAEIVERMRATGASDALVLAGDAEVPAGEFDGALPLLRALAEVGQPFRDVGITGYPESHAVISDTATIKAMFEKEAFATYIVSQICFDPKVTAAWMGAVWERGTRLPIHIGLPGAVSGDKLLRVCERIRVGNSIELLRSDESTLDWGVRPGCGCAWARGEPRRRRASTQSRWLPCLHVQCPGRDRVLATAASRRRATGTTERSLMPVEVEIVRSVEVPTRLVHGPGALARLGETLRELGVTRPLLVTDPGVAAAGLADLALEHLDDAVVFDEVRPNPDIALVDEGARSYVDSQCDGLVGLGGGSSMDTAKSIGVVARHGGSIADYEWGHAPISERIPPLVAIPTTAGTGSEVTLWAVITDRERKIKFNVGGTPLIGAHVALIDPELMLGLPATVTAATGMDALSHAIECFTCDYHQPFNDAVALQAIELVAAWLRTAVADGSDLEARTQMAHAAMLGGMAYGTESAGAAHAMSQSAGGVHDCPHGALTARVLGPVMEYNAAADPVRHARIAQGLGVDISGLSPLDAAVAGVDELYRLTDDVGIPTMEALGFSEDEIPMLARIAFEDPQTIGNAREVDVAAYEDIYRNAFSRGAP